MISIFNPKVESRNMGDIVKGMLEELPIGKRYDRIFSKSPWNQRLRMFIEAMIIIIIYFTDYVLLFFIEILMCHTLLTN